MSHRPSLKLPKGSKEVIECFDDVHKKNKNNEPWNHMLGDEFESGKFGLVALTTFRRKYKTEIARQVWIEFLNKPQGENERKAYVFGKRSSFTATGIPEVEIPSAIASGEETLTISPIPIGVDEIKEVGCILSEYRELQR